MKLIKIPYDNAQKIFSFYDANNEICQLASDDMSPYELIQLAIDEELYADAITYLAHGMPVREAIWWACCCASQRQDWNEQELDAIRAAKAWVHTPDETSRRFAEAMAESATLDTGAGWVAQAAFWSGGSMTSPKDPIVPPPAYLYAQAVAGSINLTAVLPDGEEAKQRYKSYFDIGLNIAKGGNGEI